MSIRVTNLTGENLEEQYPGPENEEKRAWVRHYGSGSDVARALLAAVEAESGEHGRGVSYSSHKFADLLVSVGYHVVTEHALGALYLKPSGAGQTVRFIETRVPDVELDPARVVVDLYWNYWCSDCSYGRGDNGLQAVREGCAEAGDAVLLREHELDRPLIEELGLGHNMLLVDGKDVSPFVCLTSREWVRDTIREARQARTAPA